MGKKVNPFLHVSGWCFAMLNGRPAEIYFRRRPGRLPEVLGHCYVRRSEFRTKKERQQIDRDMRHVRLSYRHRVYRSMV